MTLKKQHFALSNVAKPTKVPDGYQALLKHFQRLFYDYVMDDSKHKKGYHMTVTPFEEMSYSYKAKYLGQPIDKIVTVFFKADLKHKEGRFLEQWFHDHYYDLKTVNETVSQALNECFLIPIGEAKNIEFEIENPELPDTKAYNIRITFDLYKEKVYTTTEKPTETTTTTKVPKPQNITVKPTPNGGDVNYD